jgi:hypothetical protein
MSRAALPALAILGLSGTAAAEPWTVRMESGGEGDTNVSRVETAIGTPPRIAAGAGRLGARIGYRGEFAGGGYLIETGGLARMIASSSEDLKDENVVLGTADVHWLRPFAGGAIAAGVHLTAADSFGLLGGTGARTFRNLGGDAMFVLSRDEHRLTVALGGRDFKYKPQPPPPECEAGEDCSSIPPLPPHMFDWRGLVASAQLDSLLWQTSDRTQNLELAATFGFEQRGYASTAVTNCTPHEPVTDPCSMPTTLRRRDRYQRAGVALTWTGGVVATGSYQLTVNDSNSYGQSLTRHRIGAQVTVELFGRLFATAAGTLQIDEYPDGVPVFTDVQHQEFINLEDESRSSLQVLLTRALSSAWTIEARGALWRDFESTSATTFRRTLFYGGVSYVH